jgi:adenosylcobinamide amidohydrolase
MKSQEEQEFLSLRIVGETLVVKFRRPTHVVSWAPLNGGMRTHASHIINHCVADDFNCVDPQKTLRQVASRIGIKGTFVGMMTAADVSRYSMARGVHQDLRAYAIATAGCGNVATVGETGAYAEGESQPIPPGTINLIVAVNYGFTHEAMLEAIAIATEAKVRVMYEFGLTSRTTGQPATGTGTDCVAVASGHDRRYLYCGKHTKWGELIGRPCPESIRGALRAAISFERGESGRQPNARLAKKETSTKRNDSFGRHL